MSETDIRDLIRAKYTDAVTRGASCCEPTKPAAGGPQAASCCSTDAETASARSGARTSFGCGDPLSLMDVHAGQTILDIGSGPGADAIAAARLVGPAGAVIGVDMTDAMLERARLAASAAGLANLEFRRGDAEALPVQDASVDWVISNCVVNLVPDKQRAFREIFRVLRPGGRFSISDLIGENLPPEILSDREKYCACIGGAPSEEAYLDAARRAGLEDIEVVDRFRWEAPELEGSEGMVWSLKVTGRRPLTSVEADDGAAH